MKPLVPCLLSLVLLVGCPGPSGREVSWLAMGTTASVKWHDTREFVVDWAPKDVRKAFARIEELLNAHDPSSELSRLAPLSDADVLATCSEEVRPCYEAAFKLRDQSGGVFNPRWRGTNTLDLGAIAKGFAVDRAIQCWVDCDVREYWRILVDLGGNLRAAGTKGWKVGIAGSDESLTLTNGMACATSGEYFRGKHIRDGRTGAAVSNGVYSVTVVHPTSAMLADGLSTTLFILGRERGEAFLGKHYPEARAIWIMRHSMPTN